MKIIDMVKEIQTDIIEWRRELHKIPELGFDLVDTSSFVRRRLEEMGIEYRVIAETGIIATIRGELSGKTIALRADMDGLPIIEQTGLDFASSNGCMHACGHDAHVAMLLGAAMLLSKNSSLLKGNVRLIFQPAEENVGGALKMIEEGCLENPGVSAIFGLHIGKLTAEMNTGDIGIMEGPMMAAVDDFSVRVIGKGGHGAAPHECVDPITTAAEIICSLQKIISREFSPVNPGVLTIGKITGGTAFNIIPDEVYFEGCVRTLDSGDRSHMERRIEEMVMHIARANRADYEIKYNKKYPILINDIVMTRVLENSAEKIVGSNKVVRLKKPIMASEDMSYYLERVPGTFFYLGSNNSEKGIVYPHHHPKFNVDEDVLWIGTSVFVQTVLDYLV